MPNFSLKFLGITDGNEVSISALRTSEEVSVGPVAWGRDPAATDSRVQIVDLKVSSLVAPATIFCEVQSTDFGVEIGDVGEYDPSAHDLYHLTSITKDGDPSYATSFYTAPINLPVAHKVKGTKISKRWGHCFDTGGTYRVQSTVINMATGETRTSPERVYVIQEPAAYFSAAQTFIVDPTGTGTGAPTTSNPIYTTMAAAQAAANAISGLARAWFCIRANTSLGTPDVRTSNPTCATQMVSIFGGSTPAYNAGAGGIRMGGAGCTSFHLRDIDVRGNANFAADTPETGVNAFWRESEDSPSNAIFSTWNAGATDTGIPYYGHLNARSVTNSWTMFANFRFDRFYSAGSLTDGSQNAILFLGGRMITDPLASVDNKGRGGFGFRFGTHKIIQAIDQCDMFTHRGWFHNYLSITTAQPAIRFQSGRDGTGNGCHTMLLRSHLEGQAGLQETSGGSNPNTAPMNFIVDSTRILQMSHGFGFLYTDCPGVTVRNVECVLPSAEPPQDPSWFREAIILNVSLTGTASPDVLALPIKVYNSSIHNLRADGTTTRDLLIQSGGYTGGVTANNIIHRPYTSSAIVPGDFELVQVIAGPRFIGYRDALPGVDPTYNILYVAATGTPQVGEAFVGSISGLSKTYRGVGDPSGQAYASFDFEISNQGPVTTNRFTGGEVATGAVSGATFTFASGEDSWYFNPYDKPWNDTPLVERSVTATHVITYTGETQPFVVGRTITGATSGATATICQVHDLGTSGRLFLRYITGTFQVGEVITGASAGGSATAGAVQNSGVSHVWKLITNNTRDPGVWRFAPYSVRDYFQRIHTTRGPISVE